MDKSRSRQTWRGRRDPPNRWPARTSSFASLPGLLPIAQPQHFADKVRRCHWGMPIILLQCDAAPRSAQRSTSRKCSREGVEMSNPSGFEPEQATPQETSPGPEDPAEEIANSLAPAEPDIPESVLARARPLALMLRRRSFFKSILSC